jgi:hypothetical protein
MTAITWSVMTARNTGAAAYAATDLQLAELAVAMFMPAEAPAQITIRNRTLRDGLTARRRLKEPFLARWGGRVLSFAGQAGVPGWRLAAAVGTPGE